MKVQFLRRLLFRICREGDGRRSASRSAILGILYVLLGREDGLVQEQILYP
jgi:hypothetical protein